MKKVIIVLVLTLGACVSASATSACYGNLLQNVGDACAASVDGTTFSVSLVGLTNSSLTNPAVNLNVTASSSTPGTDTFSVQVLGANSTHFNDNIGAVNFDVSVSGNSGAAVTNVTTMVNGRSVGATVSTDVTATGGMWSLSSSRWSNSSSSNSISPAFVSSEIDTGLNLPSGLDLAGYTETFTVIWTAYTPPPPPGPPPPPPPPPPPNDPPPPPDPTPEPASVGLVALVGLVGGLYAVRRRLNK